MGCPSVATHAVIIVLALALGTRLSEATEYQQKQSVLIRPGFLEKREARGRAGTRKNHLDTNVELFTLAWRKALGIATATE